MKGTTASSGPPNYKVLAWRTPLGGKETGKGWWECLSLMESWSYFFFNFPINNCTISPLFKGKRFCPGPRLDENKLKKADRYTNRCWPTGQIQPHDWQTSTGTFSQIICTIHALHLNSGFCMVSSIAVKLLLTGTKDLSGIGITQVSYPSSLLILLYCLLKEASQTDWLYFYREHEHYYLFPLLLLTCYLLEITPKSPKLKRTFLETR